MVLQFCGVAARDKQFVFRVEATTCTGVPGDAKLSGWHSHFLVQDLVEEGEPGCSSPVLQGLESQVCHHGGDTGMTAVVIVDPSGGFPLCCL